MRTLLVPLVLGVVACGSPAQAQNPSLIKPKGMVMPTDANKNKDLQRKAMVQFAECSLKSRRTSVMQYLAIFPGSQEAYKRMQSLADYDCIGAGYIRFTESLFRGAVYQTLYADTFRHEPVADLKALASPDYAEGGNPASISDGQEIALRRYSDCVVRADPKTAHELLVSSAGSPAEGEAFGTLTTSLSYCLAKGDTLKFSKSVLRGALAEVLYRIRSDAVPATASAQAPKSEG